MGGVPAIVQVAAWSRTNWHNTKSGKFGVG